MAKVRFLRFCAARCDIAVLRSPTCRARPLKGNDVFLTPETSHQFLRAEMRPVLASTAVNPGQSVERFLARALVQDNADVIVIPVAAVTEISYGKMFIAA